MVIQQYTALAKVEMERRQRGSRRNVTDQLGYSARLE